MPRRGWFERTIGDYLPRGEALGTRDRAAFLAGARAPIRYSSEPRSSLPAFIPFQLFGLEYAEDIVIETQHPHWTMHELARVEHEGRSFWIAKDSDPSGVQTVTADLEAIESWLPEIPVLRRRGPLQVVERSSAERLDVELAYTNPLGERTEVRFSSPRPRRDELLRNGSTFDHSQQIAAVVLDISRKQLVGVEASVRYDGREIPVRRAIGLVPVKALLQQTQAGFVTTSARISSEPSKGATPQILRIARPLAGVEWPTRADQPLQIVPFTNGCSLRWTSGPCRYEYDFVAGELWRAAVVRASAPSATPLVELQLSVPLPDLRRRFEGSIARRFVLLVNGLCQGYGRLRASTSEDGAELSIEPLRPSWFRARPLCCRIEAAADGQTLVCERVGDGL